MIYNHNNIINLRESQFQQLFIHITFKISSKVTLNKINTKFVNKIVNIHNKFKKWKTATLLQESVPLHHLMNYGK